MGRSTAISENSRRVARNTLLLYFRMLLLMAIGLVTSRVILKSLGIESYGIYNAVAGVVIMFTLLSNSIAQAISRFITFELGRGGDGGTRLKTIFTASVWVQAGLCVLLAVLVNTLGLWFLYNKMDIPAGRMTEALAVMEFALATLMINLLAVPFNATIIAHERMDAFAWISILEAGLKLAVALVIWLWPGDRLTVYAALMAAVAFAVRLTYASFCRKHFEESRGSRKLPEKTVFRELAGFAGWNFFGSSAFVINTQGMNLLTNVFFGVAANAARGVAGQVEGIVKQFATSFLTAINPQITKSYASGDRKYCFELVTKGARYTYLILLLFAVPFAFEADYLLELWLGNVPPHSADFVRLAIIGIMVDMVCNPLLTLELSYGRIRNYYLVTGFAAYLALPAAWLLFRYTDAPVSAPYWVFIATYFIVDVIKLAFVRRQMAFPVGRFLLDVAGRCGAVTLISVSATFLVWKSLQGMAPAWVILLAVLAAATLWTAVSSWFIAMTPGEREFAMERIRRKSNG